MTSCPVNIKILDPRIGTEFPLPEKQTPGSAGVDLRAMVPSPVTLAPGERWIVGSGISIQLPGPGTVALVVPRSGLGSRGIILSNGTGVIDSDYTGEIKVTLWNTSEDPFVVTPGLRVAQMLVMPVETPEFHVVDAHRETERGTGGFGSTGTG